MPGPSQNNNANGYAGAVGVAQPGAAAETQPGTALDYSPSNRGGLRPYEWTNWQSVFQPRLGGMVQPQAPGVDQPQGPTQGGVPVAPNPVTGQQIIAGRQAARNQVIMGNPLWKAFQPKPQQAQSLANVSEPGSAGEDAQSMFGNVQDPLATATSAPPVAAPAAPAAMTTPQYGFRSLSTPYGTASVRFGGQRFAGGGAQLRF